MTKTKITNKVIAIFLAVLTFVSVFSATAAAASNKEKQNKYKVYTALGDSASSGFGLKDYYRHNELVLFDMRIKGSYPDIIAKDLKVKKLNPLGVSGIRTSDLHFLLDSNYSADYITKHDMAMLSENFITEDHLDELRPRYQHAVKESDLITLDIGFDDIWVPTIACIYDIAEDGRFDGKDADKTLREKVAIYGSYRVVLQNVIAYLMAWFTHPHKWLGYWEQWVETVLTFLNSFFYNYNEVVRQIYKLNPKVTVVGMGCYNPCYGWDLLPNDRAVQRAIQPYYDLVNAEKAKYEKLYDNYIFVDTDGIELMSNETTLPLYENLTYDESGFNPHPTAKSHRILAGRVEAALGF